MFKSLLPLALTISLAMPIAAQDFTAILVEDTIDSVSFSLESAILDKGLTIDFISHTGEMLERTRKDVGSDVVLFSEATIFNFCSARVSRQVMEAKITNIAYCPYAIYIYATPDTPNQTTIGHRIFPGTSMQPANDLLDEIIAEAVRE
ncbi:MAG: DUF302 domain-containing protein [Paracoccaceae bacterium]